MYIFCIKVNKKKGEKQIDVTNAIFEVYADRITEKMNTNKALLWIVTMSTENISEFCVRIYI